MMSNVTSLFAYQLCVIWFQFAMSGANRSLPPQNLSDQSEFYPPSYISFFLLSILIDSYIVLCLISVFNMGGAANGSGMMGMQQQQQQFGNMSSQSGQNLQQGMVQLQNTSQNHPNFQQQRPQNQQQ